MAINRVQALQVLGLKAGALPEQITDAYHRLHPGAMRAQADGHPERLRRLDEAYRLLLGQADRELQDFKPSDENDDDRRARVQSDHERRKETHRRNEAARGAQRAFLLVVVLLIAGAVGLWYLGMIPGLPKFPGR
jgi:hypothetical protein